LLLLLIILRHPNLTILIIITGRLSLNFKIFLRIVGCRYKLGWLLEFIILHERCLFLGKIVGLLRCWLVLQLRIKRIHIVNFIDEELFEIVHLRLWLVDWSLNLRVWLLRQLWLRKLWLRHLHLHLKHLLSKHLHHVLHKGFWHVIGLN
jgi:hypothetical protein